MGDSVCLALALQTHMSNMHGRLGQLEVQFGMAIEHYFLWPMGKGELPGKLSLEVPPATSVNQKSLLTSDILEAAKMPT